MFRWLNSYLTQRRYKRAERKFHDAMMTYPSIEHVKFDLIGFITTQFKHQDKQEILDALNQHMFEVQHQNWTERK